MSISRVSSLVFLDGIRAEVTVVAPKGAMPGGFVFDDQPAHWLWLLGRAMKGVEGGMANSQVRVVNM
jgi:hypothetical protein